MTDDNIKQPPPDDPKQSSDPRKDLFNLGRATVPPALHDAAQRVAWQLPAEEDKPGAYMIELNLMYSKGVQKAAEAFKQLYTDVLGQEAQQRPAIPISKTYFRCNISVNEWKALTKRDEEKGDTRDRVIYKIWPDFPLNPLIDHSVATVKADAAFRSYSATGEGVCWAVIDSGVDKNHLHFGDPQRNGRYKTLLDPSVRDLHRDFTLDDPQPDSPEANSALTDGFGHGTHVAGIIAGGLDDALEPGKDFMVFENVFESDPGGNNRQISLKPRGVSNPAALRGVAPQCKLVNLSLGYEFDAEMFACGQSPLCVEVDRLVRSGVVVVVAAGNTGYASIQTRQRITKIGISSTINDPGNSTLAITVGATHRDSPHTYGVSYFSSKGPTGDGRIKPDLVAPGERITSCVPGKKLERLALNANVYAYIDDTGTSMAAPHVSGAIAAFLSIRREFLQRPEEVKRIFLESATPLGREKYFEGRGLVDLMRAIQTV